MGSRKGGSYERQICTDLSMWWSEGYADDWYRLVKPLAT